MNITAIKEQNTTYGNEGSVSGSRLSKFNINVTKTVQIKMKYRAPTNTVHDRIRATGFDVTQNSVLRQQTGEALLSPIVGESILLQLDF